jgi:hypothetical protein
MDDKLQAYDLLEMLILKLALHNLDDNHHLMSSSHGHITRPIGPMWHIPYALYVDQTRIQSLIFVLVNLESSHALSQYLEPDKEFFI